MIAPPTEEALDAVASACGFLAHVFLRKDAGPTAVAALDAELVADWPLARDADTARGVDLLLGSLRMPRAAADYHADYTQLFVGPGPMAACPWESVHRSQEGLTFEEQTLQVRQAYALMGRRAPALNREPDDHIGLELAFVGELAVAALAARDRGDPGGEASAVEAAARFHAEHLSVWGPGFADLVIAHARTDLYRGAGHLLRGALPQFTRILAGPSPR